LKNAKKQKPTKNQVNILNTEIQANRWAHFSHSACHGGGAHPCPPPVTPLDAIHYELKIFMKW